MKKFLKSLVIVTLLISFALSSATALAESPLENLQQVGEETQLPDFFSSGQHPDAPSNAYAPGVGTVTSPIFFALDLFRYVVSTIAVIMIIISSMKLIGTTKEEEATKQKDHLIFGIIGLIGIQLADPLVKKMFFGETGDAFQDIGTAKLYAEGTVTYVRGLIGFWEFFLAAVAVLVIVVRGFTLITSGGDEEAMTKAKSHIGYAIAGLVVLGISEFIVLEIFFPKQGASLPDVNQGKRLLKDISNFIAGFISIFSFAALFYAGYKYVASGGDEEVNEQAKKLFTGAVIALLLSLGAFALVNTLIELDPGPDSSTVIDELIDSN
ncbi:hypothetical protein JKY72_04295 [Candidatus Gracilibacteria bacterium]|nr:hypothetical protein [Candidatus Gracilibacteria bacterium]